MLTKESILVDHSDNRRGEYDLMSKYSVDGESFLNIPKNFGLGTIGPSGDKIESYADQVDEYRIWLEDQIKAEHMPTLIELDKIYNMALDNGVVIQTRCCPAPYITHAHILRETILRLAGVKFDL